MNILKGLLQQWIILVLFMCKVGLSNEVKDYLMNK